MDGIAIATLEAETTADVRIVEAAANLARKRYGSATDTELEATAYQLARLYNAVEQLGTRIAKAFENHIDDASGWLVELVRRLSLEIPGVRPALFAPELVLVDQAEACAKLLPVATQTLFVKVRAALPT